MIAKRPTVVLINPRMCSPSSARLPLSLLFLGSVLDGKYDWCVVDGNIDPHAVQSALGHLDAAGDGGAVVGITVMPGPQVGPAIEMATAIRAAHPRVPIAWGGFFPTLYPAAAINAPYVDYVVRGQGEMTLLELLEADGDEATLNEIRGLTWKRGGETVHNLDRGFRPPDTFPLPPYSALDDVNTYLRPSFLGSRTAVHQAAIGCRYRCSFCGVVSMFNGHTTLQGADRLATALETLTHEYGANAMQFYDHNFFDKEETSLPTLDVLATYQLPWWCYARADTLAKFSTSTWERIRRSRLRMAYIGAEASSDEILKGMRKGTKVEHTLEVAKRCREYGVIPEFSFVLGGPEDPEGEIEKTFRFIKRIKTIHPECEVILYFYSPTPQRDRRAARAGAPNAHVPVLQSYGPSGPALPTTPEEWTQRRWIDYVCHRDAPWLSERTRQRVEGFAKVLACRFPTVQDYITPGWGKNVLRGLASWRYSTGRYGKAWELDVAKRLIPLREPERESI